jgi:hypothetical protein
MSQLYVDNIKNRTGGAVSFSQGIVAVGGTISGNLSIGGTLTYEDVTNVDSVGVITARAGIKVSSGGINVNQGGITIVGGGLTVSGVVTTTSLSATNVSASSSVTATNFYGDFNGNATGLTGSPDITVGSVTATSFAGNGASITNIDAGNIATGIVTTARLGGGTANATTFLNGHGQFVESGGAWSLISTITAASASTVDFTSGINSTYHRYVVMASDIAGANEMKIYFYKGGVLQTGSNYQVRSVTRASTTNGSTQSNTQNPELSTGTQGFYAGVGMMEFSLDNPSATKSNYKATYTLSGNQGTNFGYATGSVSWEQTGPVDGIRFYTTNGSITSTFRLYGIK